MNKTQIIVAGGGMVGATTALALGQAGIDVLLLERYPPQCSFDPETHALRVSAINRASQNVLRHLGAWEVIVQQRATPYQKMRVWDAGGSGEISFDAADLGEPDLGHIIENRVIQCALWDQLADCEAVTVLEGSVEAFTASEEGPVVTLEDASQWQAELVVAADGANSQLRDLAGIAVRGWPYGQTGLVATIKPERGHQSTAWQRFMSDGPLALLPLDKDLFSIVWSASTTHAEHLQQLPVEEFEQVLTSASENRLGHLSLVSERQGFPLRLQHAERYVMPGLALVGDAAHVIHPLAGQGVNLGMLDAAMLVQIVVEARQQHKSVGDLAVLRRYERARKGDNTITQMTMDGFKRFFSNDLLPLQVLRNLGLNLADRVIPVKHQFMHAALGDVGELPTLARSRS
ncbi:MAG: UbiH/UbiF/VisC/COQ6 family ubiquinone biosynthesis hydroxylase [bacterium]